MAIWQFQCNIIPTRINIDRLSRDEMISWKGVSQPPHELKFLEQEKSWSRDIIQYGKSDETCIEFMYSDNMLDEIFYDELKEPIEATYDGTSSGIAYVEP